MTEIFVPVLLWLALGLGAGLAYWRSLRWSVGALASGRSVALPIVLQLVRFAAVGAALAFVAIRWGGPALLACTAGLMLARFIVLRTGARA